MAGEESRLARQKAQAMERIGLTIQGKVPERHPVVRTKSSGESKWSWLEVMDAHHLSESALSR